MDEQVGLPLTEENIETVLDEIRPYLVGTPLTSLLSHFLLYRWHEKMVCGAGTGGGGLELVAMEGPIVKVRITGQAAGVMTVRVAVSQKLREKFPTIAAVQLVS